MMHDDGKSDDLIVPEKEPNKGRHGRPAEAVEERRSTKGNSAKQNRDRAQDRTHSLPNALERVRGAAKKDGKLKFTTLWHHVANVEHLRNVYNQTKRRAAPGIDGVTWQEYGQNLKRNLEDLKDRLHRGAYRARPVERVYIPKADGRKRPLGIPVLEDKIVQKATANVLNAIYEVDFKGFSYGFRPGRNQHNALDALHEGIMRRKVNWVLDADIRGFFDAIDHEWLIKFVEHRIQDKRVIRHIQKWLKAGVLEDGKWRQQKEGTPQGGSISPLLANIYLHYAFDLWADQWRKRHARGDVIIVRYADDFVVGFQYQADAQRFRKELETRLSRFNLELHPEKTRLIEFGRYASERRERRGDPKPETFDFLGFTHICGKDRKGRFKIVRKTIKKRLRAKLKAISQELKRRMHWPVPEVGKWLRAVINGHYQYYGVPGNIHSLNAFQLAITKLWKQALTRRSQRGGVTWERMSRLVQRWLPAPSIKHPYPNQRLIVRTRGRSPVR